MTSWTGNVNLMSFRFKNCVLKYSYTEAFIANHESRFPHPGKNEPDIYMYPELYDLVVFKQQVQAMMA